MFRMFDNRGSLTCLALSMMLIASFSAVCAAPDVLDLPPVAAPANPLANITVGAYNDADTELLKIRVAADKAAVDEALKDIDGAFNAYMSFHEAKIKESRAKGKPLTPAQSVLAEPDAKKRKPVFAANLQKIKKLNEASGDFLSHGINEFSALTEKEFADLYSTNISPESSALKGSNRKLLQTNICNNGIAFPYGNITPNTNGVDWKTPGFVTSVKNQGGCGSCVAHATIAAVEACFISRYAYLGYNKDNTDLSEQDLLTCTAGDQCLGTSIDKYFDRLTCRGALFESQRPYTATDNDVCSTATRFNTGMSKWSVVPAGQTPYKQAMTRAPIVVGIQAGPLQTYKSGIFNCGALTTAVNHAVTAVAYQNSVLMASGQRWNVLTIKNSWGSWWGESGYLRVRMDCSGRGSLGIYDYALMPIMA